MWLLSDFIGKAGSWAHPLYMACDVSRARLVPCSRAASDSSPEALRNWLCFFGGPLKSLRKIGFVSSFFLPPLFARRLPGPRSAVRRTAFGDEFFMTAWTHKPRAAAPCTGAGRVIAAGGAAEAVAGQTVRRRAAMAATPRGASGPLRPEVTKRLLLKPDSSPFPFRRGCGMVPAEGSHDG